ncbi:MAG: DUF262 domain-containing protein [Anaerolineaceae bacterium]|nr:DUF262 domain-containing protein [Anaerolineaceae bacterium]
MAFNPRSEYVYERVEIPVKEFREYHEEYVTRPAYQRKVVWDKSQQQKLLESLFMRYFIPGIVIREVRLTDTNTIREVIDGQQRIITVQRFFSNQLELPDSERLAEIDPLLPKSKYRDLPVEIRRFADRYLKYEATIIKNIDEPMSDDHRRTASDIFWRLQQGESLNSMETAHSRISSLVRNFLVKYASDYDFDYESYREVNPNPHKHIFFLSTRTRTNSRMQHLTLLGRFLLLERASGPTRIGDAEISSLIEETQEEDGIGNLSFEEEPVARATLLNLTRFYKVFHDDPTLEADTHRVGIPALKSDYFTISFFLLIRHLWQHYAVTEEVRLLVRDFAHAFFGRTDQVKTEDVEARDFVENSQQDFEAITERDQIIRHEFFRFARKREANILVKDSRRAFNEAERIAIFRKDRGRCQHCIQEGKPESETIVRWDDFEADHVLPHSQGGQTLIENGQVLCRIHNRRKGATA